MEAELVLQIRCCDYIRELDDNENPTFLLKVCLRSDEILSYEVLRSFTDFVDFDSNIRRSIIVEELILPSRVESLVETSPCDTLVIKDLRVTSELEKNDNIVVTIAENFYMMIHNYCQTAKTGDKDSKEIGDNLDFYLQDILSRHEVVASDVLRSFLDPGISPLIESVQSAHIFKRKEFRNRQCFEDPISIHDVLLQDVIAVEKKVTDRDIYSGKIIAGQTIVWKFKTVGYQTGLAIEMNGVTKMYYPSCFSEKDSNPICGTFKAEESGVCSLFWTPVPKSSICKTLMHPIILFFLHEISAQINILEAVYFDVYYQK